MELGNFVKTQGILLAQVVYLLILKLQDIATFGVKFQNVSVISLMKLAQISEIAQGKFPIG